jgi:hypothetical protein
MNTPVPHTLSEEKIARYLCLSFFCLVLSVYGYANTCTANASSAWNSISVWSCGNVPVCGDTIVISASITVTINAQQDYSACNSSMLVQINGILYFEHGFKLKLPCGSQIVVSNGGQIQADQGNGNSNYIEICGNNMWNSGCGTLNGPLSMPPYDCSPLPVTLTSFTADAVKNYSLLSWTTSSEINNDYFSIQKSKDAEHFFEIGRVAGSGNSTSMHNYSYIDEFPYEDFSYYRLNQVDYDGTSDYSGVVAVKFDKKGLASFLVYTDYNNESIIISLNTNLNANANYHILDMLGNNIVSGSIRSDNGSNKIVISTHQLAKGVYIISFSDGIHHLAEKIFF